MASIYKPTRVSDGKRVKCQYWRIAYVDENGRRRSVRGFKDKVATEKKAREIETRIERIKAGIPVEAQENASIPIETAINACANEMARRGLSAFNVSETKRIVTVIVKACNWSRLNSVTRNAFEDYLAKMKSRGLSAGTINRHHEMLRKFLNWCVNTKRLAVNPIGGMKMAATGGEHRAHKRRAFTQEEFKKLIAAAPPQAAVIYKIAAFSGLRRSEIKSLTLDDFEKGRWTLRADITKNGRAENIPMLPECWETIEPFTHLERIGDLFGLDGTLTAKVPDMRALHRHMKKAGIERHDAAGRVLDFHSLRYFFCTMLAKKLPIQQVRILMRHSDIRLTAQTYLDLGLTDVADSLTALPRILGNQKNENPERDKKHAHRPKNALPAREHSNEKEQNTEPGPK